MPFSRKDKMELTNKVVDGCHKLLSEALKEPVSVLHLPSFQDLLKKSGSIATNISLAHGIESLGEYIDDNVGDFFFNWKIHGNGERMTGYGRLEWVNGYYSEEVAERVGGMVFEDLQKYIEAFVCETAPYAFRAYDEAWNRHKEESTCFVFFNAFWMKIQFKFVQDVNPKNLPHTTQVSFVCERVSYQPSHDLQTRGFLFLPHPFKGYSKKTWACLKKPGKGWLTKPQERHKKLAVAQSLHERLGAESGLGSLGPDLLHKITAEHDITRQDEGVFELAVSVFNDMRNKLPLHPSPFGTQCCLRCGKLVLIE